MNRSDRLTPQQGQALVHLARLALDTRIGKKSRKSPQIDPRLIENGATFVTLTVDGALRGCIGTPEAHSPLVNDVQENAVRAATMDPRFPPVAPHELNRIHVEVSVLTSPRLLECPPEERAEQVRPGVDGLLLTSGLHRGLLLPQVWEKLPGSEDFLATLCRKAGLPPTAWQQPDTELYTFQVQAFHEQ
jgi:AmmeMemoRadiSam system protein A